MNLPSRKKQAEIIKHLIKENSFQKDEQAFLISESWLIQWKDAVGFETNNPTNEAISKIDNNSLLFNGHLKKGIIQYSDYEIFPQAIWNQFLEWYGGGPAISVQIEYDPLRQSYVPVTRLKTINLIYNNNKKSFHISKYKTIGDLKKMGGEYFNLPIADYKIYDILNGQKDIELKDSQIISELFLHDGRTLYLDLPIKQADKNVPNSNSHSILPSNHHQIQQIRQQNKDELLTIKQMEIPDDLTVSTSFLNSSSDNLRSSTLFIPKSTSLTESFTSTQSDIFHSNHKTIGIVGLANLGNTCFFNSALQCLLHSKLLIDYFLTDKYRNDLAPTNPLGTKCQLVNAFARLIQYLSSKKSGTISPRDLLSILSHYAPHFADYGQHDAHELLIFLLDLLHEDLNRAKQNYKSNDKPNEEEEVIQGDGTNDNEIAERMWTQYKKSNNSIIVDLFHGMLRSQLICPICHNKVVIFEPFVSLSLPIPGTTFLSPEFLFIPYDPCLPKNKMTMFLSFGLTTSSFKRNLNRQIGRQFDMIFALRSKSTGHLVWSNELPSTHLLSELLIFEIPDRNHFYAVSSLNVNIQRSNFLSFLFSNTQLLDDLLLIPLESSNPSEEDFSQACIDRLAYLWDSQNRKVDEAHDDSIIDSITTFEPFANDLKDKKIKVESINSFYVRSQSFNRNKSVNCILNLSLKITLNPIFMNDNSGFNWSHLKRPTIVLTNQDKEMVQPTLENCIHQFVLEMVLDESNKWYCPTCKEFVCANKKTSVWSLPKCLIFQFKRFTQYYNTFRKNEGRIEFPDTSDFARFIQGPVDGVKTKYRLYAVCEHFGSLYGGHYIAHAYVEDDNSWYLFNDSSCRAVSQKSVHNEAAYLLFYEQIEE